MKTTTEEIMKNKGHKAHKLTIDLNESDYKIVQDLREKEQVSWIHALRMIIRRAK